MNKYRIILYKSIKLIRIKGISEFILRVIEKLKYNRKIRQQLKTYINSQSKFSNKKNIGINPKISIVVPVYKTNLEYLSKMIKSVIQQKYSNWELCIFNGGSRDKNVTNLITDFSSKDKRIIYKESDDNFGIAGNTNKALELATGLYIGLLDHDDVLSEDALYECVKVIEETGADLIYTDEDKVTEDGEKFMEPHIKSKWAPNTLRSYNYICHFLVFKSSLLDNIKKFNSEYDGSQDYEFILRLTEQAEKIYHIPKILYHWRINSQSTALNIGVKEYAIDSGRRALEENLICNKLNYKVNNGRYNGSYITTESLETYPEISLILIGKWNNEEDIIKKINEIKSMTDYDNYCFIVCNKKEINKIHLKEKDINICDCSNKSYSQTINYILKNTNTEINIVIDSDIQILDSGWCKKLVGQSQEKDIVIVSGKIMKNNRVIYSNGISVTNKGIFNNYRNCYKKFYGYMGRNTIINNVTAVNEKLYLIKRSVVEKCGYLDEKYNSEISFIDYCIRINVNKGYIKTIPDEIAIYRKKENNSHKTEEENQLLITYKDLLKEYDIYSPIIYN